MSTIRVDNFAPSAGGTEFGIEGIAKAWANLDGSGTITLNGSYNVDSVTDVATGRFTFNFTNNMADANYSFHGTCEQLPASTNICVGRDSSTVLSSSEVPAQVRSGGGTNTDQDFVGVSVNGDLA